MKIPPAQTPFNLSARSASSGNAASIVEQGQLCTGDEELWREAVELWVEWHNTQQQLTAAMFACRNNPAHQAELMQEMDQLDQLRWRAVEISQELLSASPV